MANWIDLSAHNLALWRVGDDEQANGEIYRSYLLAPIFPDQASSAIPESSSLFEKFRSYPAIGKANTDSIWVWRRNLKKEPMPSLQEWASAFPNAVLRDRESATFQPFLQGGIVELDSLPLRSPWAFSPSDKPYLVYANESQADVASVDKRSFIRSAEEVDPRMVRPLEALSQTPEEANFPTDVEDTEIVSVQEQLLQETPAKEEDPDASKPETDKQETGKREDYGEYVPGARKSQYAEWENKYNAIRDAMAEDGGERKVGLTVLEALAKETKRDVFLADWVAEKKSTPGYPATPKQVLRSVLLDMLPASVKSLPWDGGRRWKPTEMTLAHRIDGFALVLQEIRKRVDALPEQPSGEEFLAVLDGEFSPVRTSHLAKNVIPSTNYYEESGRVSSGDVEKLRDPLVGIERIIHANLTKKREDIKGKVFGTLAGIAKRLSQGQEAVYTESVSTIARTVREATLPMYETYVAEKIKEVAPSESAIRLKSALMKPLYHLAKTDPAWKPFVPGMDVEYTGEGTEFSFLEKNQKKIAEALSSLAGNRIAELASADNGYSRWEPMDNFYRDLSYNPKCTPEEKEDFLEKGAWIETMQVQALLDCFSAAASLKPENAETAENQKTETSAEETEVSPEKDQSTKKEKGFLQWKPDKKEVPLRGGAENSFRDGPANERGNRDITEAELCETFGFRAVQYGNWMTQKDRQTHLNAAYDACADLQKLWDLPDSRMVALPRKQGFEERQALALALGARGRGKASAHFEPMQYTINMTKTSGAGSFLHEWTHASDNFLACEDLPGTPLLSSNIAGTKMQQYAKTLSSPVSRSITEKQLQFHAAKGWEELQKKIWKGLLGKSTQNRMAFEIERILRAGSKLPNGEYSKTTKECQDEALQKTEEYLQKAANFLSKKITEIDKLALSLKTEEDFNSFRNTVKETFLFPFQFLDNRRIREPKNGSDVLWCEQVFSGIDPAQPETGKEEQDIRLDPYSSGFFEKIQAANVDTQVASAWVLAIRSNLWGSYSREIFNHDDPLTKRYGKIVYQKNSLFYENALSLGEYWSRPEELIARAVAAFGYDRLEEQGVLNTWLTDNKPGLYDDPQKYIGDSDPQGEERAAFREAWEKHILPALQDHLQQAMEELPKVSEEAVREQEFLETQDSSQEPASSRAESLLA